MRLIFLEYEANRLEQQLIQTPSVITGTITQIQQADHEKFKYIYDVQHSPNIYHWTDFLLTNPSIRIYSRKNYHCSPGDKITILSVIKPQRENSFGLYKKKIRLAATLFEPKVIMRENNPSNISYISTKETILKRIAQKMNTSTSIFFATLFLGKSSHHFIFTDMKNMCSYWGVSHMLARSGLHLMIFVALFSFFLSYIPLYFRYKHCIIIALILLYSYLSWSSISFIRALLCMLIYHACAYLYIKISLLQALFITAAIIILINPYQSLFADFQLSFILTAALASYSLLSKPTKY